VIFRYFLLKERYHFKRRYRTEGGAPGMSDVGGEKRKKMYTNNFSIPVIDFILGDRKERSVDERGLN